jgi:5'-deoxynucleotidase YfbR-like HD superfamily hydrolase
MVKAHFNLEHLANTYRSGWLKEGRDIPKEQCESVGEHQHGMMQLAKLIRNHLGKDYKLDWLKLYEMIMRHDMPEIKIGDITPGTISAEEKKKLESDAMNEFVKSKQIPQGDFQLWEEFEKRETAEAKMAHNLDYMQMAFKAFIYSKQHNKDLSAFWKDAEQKISDKNLLEILKTVVK